MGHDNNQLHQKWKSDAIQAHWNAGSWEFDIDTPMSGNSDELTIRSYRVQAEIKAIVNPNHMKTKLVREAEGVRWRYLIFKARKNKRKGCREKGEKGRREKAV